MNPLKENDCCQTLPVTNAAKSFDDIFCLHHVFVIVLTLLILEQHSRFPELSFPMFIVSGSALVPLGLSYLIVASGRLRKATTSRRNCVRLAVFPIALLVMLSSAATHWPAAVRLQLSKGSFDKLIEQAVRGDKLAGFRGRVGLYWIQDIDDAYFDPATGTGSILFVTGSVLIDDCGLCYDTSNRPSEGYLHTKISPRWYMTEW